mgnify:CR=1 FL=1
MKSVARISLVALLMAGLAPPAGPRVPDPPGYSTTRRLSERLREALLRRVRLPTLPLVRPKEQPLVLLRNISAATPKPIP